MFYTIHFIDFKIYVHFTDVNLKIVIKQRIANDYNFVYVLCMDRETATRHKSIMLSIKIGSVGTKSIYFFRILSLFLVQPHTRMAILNQNPNRCVVKIVMTVRAFFPPMVNGECVYETTCVRFRRHFFLIVSHSLVPLLRMWHSLCTVFPMSHT